MRMEYKFPTYEEMGKEVAEKALDEFLYKGKSIREWMQIIASEDVISRQSAISIVADMQGLARADVLFTALEQLKALPPVIPTQRWIPVSERLPEKNTWVLTCYRMGNDKIDIDIKRINRWNERWEDEFDYCNTVIAWMPLPKPYKPESEGK